MADNDSLGTELAQASESGAAVTSPRRRFGRLAQVLAAIAVVVLIAFAILWSQRDRIARDLIAEELDKRGIPATYTIEHIGLDRQVIGQIVVGNPARPDLTIRRAELQVRYRLWLPAIGRVTLVEPRLYGSYRGGVLSFGSLDPVLFGGPKRPFELPALDLALRDGRALLETDYGPLGIKAEGQGRLDNGFAGILAVAAPNLAGFGCTAQRSSYYGSIRVRSGRPSLDGPLRVGDLSCPKQGLALAKASIGIDATLDRDVRGGEGRARLVGGQLALGSYRAAGSDLNLRTTYRDGALTSRIEGALAGVATPQLGLGRLESEGTLRANDGFARMEYRGTIEGTGVRFGTGIDRALAGLQSGAQGTLLAPLASQFRAAATRAAKGGRLFVDLDLKRANGVTTLVVPRATLNGGDGTALAALSRLSATSGGGAPLLAGNFTMGGAGLPNVSGRMERLGNGRPVLRMTMAEYRAGNSVLALPQLALVQAEDGSLGFSGELRASGPLPGGETQGLSIPLDGSLSAGGALAVFRRCTTVGFDRLRLANLTLQRRGITLCPRRGAPILRYADGRLMAAAGLPSLDLAGSLGETPIRMASGPVGFAYPGSMSAQRLDVVLGPAEAASQFRISNLDARFGSEIAGSFQGADVILVDTPFDLTGAAGTWRYSGGRVTIAEAGFKAVDREQPARFSPLVAQGATLALLDGVIDGKALLRHAASGREVVEVAFRHNLSDASGHADLAVRGLRFDPDFQPTDLTELAKGTVALASGSVGGTGRIDWNSDKVTSSGKFSTDNLDFAAAFGPVTGLSGTIVFADLLDLVTAPDQQVRIAAINPGIEVNDGVIRFQIERGKKLELISATWPFLGGKLSLAPTSLNLGTSEARRYTLVIDGLDAAKFVERMQLGNIQATGTFDGEMPLVFAGTDPDSHIVAGLETILGVGTAQGMKIAEATPGSGWIVDGRLRSRPPGGNVSYIGDLTYRDLSPMANFAFQTLRSLDYRTMDIVLNGSLEGEIVTNVRFDGVKQGAAAQKNLLTRAVADLPIEMRVNIRAPFLQLITSFKSMYDPAFVKDPRTIGLIDAAGRPIGRPKPASIPPEPGIQPSESEKRP